MHQTKVIEAWVEQRTAAADGLQARGPTLYIGDRPVASWLDRADENGAQIALYTLRTARSWLRLHINEAMHAIHGRLLIVPCPLPSPTPVEHAENTSHLVGAWQHSILTTARSTRYAWSNHEAAQREAAEAKLYTWAFDLPEPKPHVSHEVLSRAFRNAVANRRQRHNNVSRLPSREMLRALWRGGREFPNTFFGLLGPVMLRLSPDKNTIQTSEGEMVAVTDVPTSLLWDLACDCRQRRNSIIWRVVSERPRIGRWSVHVVRVDGSMQVGCHSLSFSEIARLAVSLGLR